MPTIDAELSQVGDKDLDEMRKKRTSRENAGMEERPAHPERVRIRNLALSRYAPSYLREEFEMDEMIFMAQPLGGLSVSAARGIREARESGYFDTEDGQRAWAHSFSVIWYRVLATIAKEA
jgi:hypothetical protein